MYLSRLCCLPTAIQALPSVTGLARQLRPQSRVKLVQVYELLYLMTSGKALLTIWDH